MIGESIPFTNIKLFDSARTLGVRIVAEAGAGKSGLMGWITFADAIRKRPVVIWDHNGGLIDNFFKLVETSKYRDELRPRIRYVELGNPTFAYRLPFYFDGGGDDPFTMSQRLIDVMNKLDPDLDKAPILGKRSLVQVGTNIGMILSSLVDGDGNRWQVTEAVDLLLNFNTTKWARRLDGVSSKVPKAVDFFRKEFSQWKPDQQRDRSYAFESRLSDYLSYDPLRAMVGGGKPTLEWKTVDQENLIVIFDFRMLRSKTALEQLSLLTFNAFLEYVTRRGIVGEKPISMVVDELPALLEFQSLEPDIRNLGAKFRAYKLWPVIGHQAGYQLSERLKESVWSFRNQIIGQQANINDAEEVVRNILGASDQEQIKKLAVQIQQLPGRQFLFKRFYDESTPDLKVRWIKKTPDIPALRPGAVSKEQLDAAKLRNQLAFAPRVVEVLQEIDARLGDGRPTSQPRPKA